MAVMTCQAAREEMLVAELAELRGTGVTPLTDHLRDCVECRARAAVILRGYGALDAALTALAPNAAGTRVLPRGRRRRKYLWLPVPLAAAAALTLLLVRREAETLPNVDALARLMQPATPLVQPPAGKQTVVIEQNDMTIVWLYNQEKL
jgi:hypothetical protein